ncbi:unnamed protein product, partial [Musa banksii]
DSRFEDLVFSVSRHDGDALGFTRGSEPSIGGWIHLRPLAWPPPGALLRSPERVARGTEETGRAGGGAPSEQDKVAGGGGGGMLPRSVSESGRPGGPTDRGDTRTEIKGGKRERGNWGREGTRGAV